MIEVTLNEFDLMFIELVRVGLSEETMELRERAIKNVKHDVVADRIDQLMRQHITYSRLNYMRWLLH